MFNGLKAAFADLTLLPLSQRDRTDSLAMAFYPVAGAVIGLVGGLVFYLAWPMGVVAAALLAVIAKTLISGGKVRRQGIDFLAARGFTPAEQGVIRYLIMAALMGFEVFALSQAGSAQKGLLALVVAHSFAVAALPCLLQFLPAEENAPDFAHAAMAASGAILLGLVLAGTQGALAILGGAAMAAALVVLLRHFWPQGVHAQAAPLMAAVSGFVVLWLLAGGA